MSEGLDATIFYVGAAALVAGVIRALRASIERNTRDWLGIALAACGLAGLAVAVLAFLIGPRALLPF